MMKQLLLKLTPVLLLVISACHLPNSKALKSIVEVYGGRFSIESGTKVSTSEGMGNFLKLTSEDNYLINNGWLSPENMANNCAVLLTKSDSGILKRKDYLEVEIDAQDGAHLYKFTKGDINSLSKDYDRVENVVVNFVEKVRESNFADAKASLKLGVSATDSVITSFLTVFKSVIPEKFRDAPLIGYRPINHGETGFEVDLMLNGNDNRSKMITAVLIWENDILKFSKITL